VGRTNFHGAVETLSDANQAGYYVFVKCERCQTQKEFQPYNLLSRYKRLIGAPLDTEIEKFYCRTCRSHVRAIISCNYRRTGEF